MASPPHRSSCMVPGGSWETADPTGLAPLADALAARGVLAVPVVVRAAADDVVYPTPVEDVLCALADAAATASAEGIDPDPLVVLGHSSGAHLAALAALDADAAVPGLRGPRGRPRRPRRAGRALRHPRVLGCRVGSPRPGRRPRACGRTPTPCCSPPDDPSCRSSCSTARTTTSSRRTSVPTSQRPFASGGHPTTLTIVPGEDHDSIYSAQVAAGPVASWLAALP